MAEIIVVMSMKFLVMFEMFIHVFCVVFVRPRDILVCEQ